MKFCSIIINEIRACLFKERELMEIRNEIKSYIVRSGWTLTDVVKEFNKKRDEKDRTTTQNISNKLSRGTIKYSEVLEIADIIGYNINWSKKP